MPAVALSDHGGCGGILEFYKTCKKENITSILGFEAYYTPDRLIKTPEAPMWHLVLLAKNLEGYHNLLKLSSLGNIEGFYKRPRIDRELLTKYHKGLVALSACIYGEIPQLIINDQSPNIQLDWYKSLFGKDFYLEIQKHGRNNEYLPQQQKVNETLIRLSREFDIPLIATCDVHYLKEHDNHKRVDLKTIVFHQDHEEAIEKFEHDSLWFKSTEEMYDWFPGQYEKEAVNNSQKILDSIEKYDIELGKVYMPKWKGKDAFETLVELSKAGLEEKMQDKWNETSKPIYYQRLEYELEVIKQTGFADYFLILRDLLKWMDQQGIIRGPGRGSAVASLVIFALNITKVDPIEYNLIFERFICPERISLADIDLDTGAQYKDQILNHLVKEFGVSNVAQVGTYTKFKPKSAIRDICKILWDKDPQKNYKTEKILTLIPEEKRGGQGEHAVTFEKILAESRIQEAINKDTDFKQVFDRVQFLEGLYRQASAHASGIVISEEPIYNRVPVAKIGSALLPITQWDMKGVEEAGLVKFDFLSLGTLDLIQETIKLIEISNGICLDIDKLPDKDKKTYQLIASGNNFGVFQFGEQGISNYASYFQPKSIKDLALITALYRPGPMDNNWHTKILEYKNSTEKTKLEFPELTETFGLPIYQENILGLFKSLAGFTYGQADIARRAIGKKKPEELKAQKAKFLEGCETNAIPKAKAIKIFSAIEKFMDYGFAASHATAYSFITYQTAWLKANFPAEFHTAGMTLEDDIEELTKWIDSARRMKIEILPPDINSSSKKFTVKEGKIIFGLNSIKGINEAAVDQILLERNQKLFKSYTDLISRISLCNAKCLRVLIDSGALDELKTEKGILLNREQFRCLINEHRIIDSKQLELFPKNKEVLIPDLKSDPIKDLILERQTIGIYLSNHPLDIYPNFPNDSILKIDENTKYIVGIIIEVRELVTKKDKKKFAAIKIEDKFTNIEATIFPRTYDYFAHLLKPDTIVVLKGQTKNREGRLNFVVNQIQTIDEIIKNRCTSIDIPLKHDLLKEPKIDLIRNVLSIKGIPITLIYKNLQIPIGCFPSYETSQKVLELLVEL